MYLAPINYDRFFERVFRDLDISKQFLQDLLNINIETIELLSRKNKITDDAAFVEFDFRCKIDGQYVIVDMQQWYKQDVVKRFFLYFCNNTSLQLENMPVMNVPAQSTGIVYKTKNYNLLEPSLTVIWMASDTLGFTDDIMAFSIFPEILHDFVRNEALWATNNMPNLLKERLELLKRLNNNTKGLDFLRKNRLIYAFQANIVKNKGQMMTKYYQWFEFAAKTQNPNNKESDFESFKNKPVFNHIMEKLRTTTLSEDDFQYIADRAEYERGVAVYDEKIRQEARQGAWDEAMLKYEPIILMLRQAEKDKLQAEKEKLQAQQKAEQEKQKAEQEKQKAKQEKQKAEQEKQKAERVLILMIRKSLKRGDSVEEIAELLEINAPTMERFLEQIKKEDKEKDLI